MCHIKSSHYFIKERNRKSIFFVIAHSICLFPVILHTICLFSMIAHAICLFFRVSTYYISFRDNISYLSFLVIAHDIWLFSMIAHTICLFFMIAHVICLLSVILNFICLFPWRYLSRQKKTNNMCYLCKKHL